MFYAKSIKKSRLQGYLLLVCLGLLLGSGIAAAETEWQTPGDHWYLVQENGESHYHSSMVRAGASLYVDESLPRHDLYVRFQVRLRFPRQNSIFSLRLVSGDQGYIFSLGSPDRHILATRGLAFAIMGQEPLLEKPEIPLAEDIWHDVELHFNPNKIAIFFNQEEVGLVEDETIASFSRLVFYNWDGTFDIRDVHIGSINDEIFSQ